MTDKDSEQRKSFIRVSDQGVVIDLKDIDIYGVKLGGARMEFKNQNGQQHEVVNRDVERDTIQLLMNECNETFKHKPGCKGGKDCVCKGN